MTEPKPGGYAHMELISKDLKKTQKFYENVFGWKFNKVADMDYSMYETPNGDGGGLRTPEARENVGTLPYISVKSVDEIAKRIEKAGGKVLVPKDEVPGWGWILIFQEPGGGVQGAWQAPDGK